MTTCQAPLTHPVEELKQLEIEEEWQHITFDAGDSRENQEELKRTAIDNLYMSKRRLPGHTLISIEPPYTELLAKSKERVSDPPHYEEVLRFPLDSWRVWESKHPRDYNEHSEVFGEKLKILKRNAQILKEDYASRGNDPKLFRGMNNYSDVVPWDEWRSGTMVGSYTGGVPFQRPPL